MAGPSYVIGDVGTHALFLAETFAPELKIEQLLCARQSFVKSRAPLEDNAFVLMKYNNGAMTRGKPSEALTRFAVPIILSNILQQLYNIIDSLVAGKFLGGSSLAAIGSTGSIVTVLVQVSAGLALGASVVIAQYYGAGKLDKIRVCGRTMRAETGWRRNSDESNRCHGRRGMR